MNKYITLFIILILLSIPQIGKAQKPVALNAKVSIFGGLPHYENLNRGANMGAEASIGMTILKGYLCATYGIRYSYYTNDFPSINKFTPCRMELISYPIKGRISPYFGGDFGIEKGFDHTGVFCTPIIGLRYFVQDYITLIISVRDQINFERGHSNVYMPMLTIGYHFTLWQRNSRLTGIDKSSPQ